MIAGSDETAFDEATHGAESTKQVSRERARPVRKTYWPQPDSMMFTRGLGTKARTCSPPTWEISYRPVNPRFITGFPIQYR